MGAEPRSADAADDETVAHGKRGAGGDSGGASTSAPRATTLTPGSRDGGRVLTSTRDALEAEELGRTRVFSRVMIVAGVFGLLLVPVLGGDPLAGRLAQAAMAVIGATYGFLHFLTSRRPERFTPVLMAWAAQVIALGSVPIAYYFGVFSAFPAIVSLGLFLYALGHPLRYVLPCLLTTSLGHAAVAAAIIAGGIPDRGLLGQGDAPTNIQIASQVCVLIVYALAVGTARISRAQTEQAVGRMEQAVRQVAQREALLEEARLELERAAWIGGPGRFTEQVLGAFRLGVVIGRGGMGEIYEARHVETGALAAVKLLTRASLGDPALHARFVREARIAQSLRSPHVVAVHDVADATAPMPFIAMERLVGRDLAAALRERRRLPLDEVVRLVAQVAEGLEAAREAGIVHRDLKPNNLFLHAPDGAEPTWKILDFGVSKLESQGGTLTEAHVVGTPSFMAPEQASGEPVDHRADVYSLACIAYRALTGHPAHLGQKPALVLHHVVHQMPVRPGSLVALPEALDLVFAVGLAKEKEARAQTAGELAALFREAAAGRIADEAARRARAVLADLDWGCGR